MFLTTVNRWKQPSIHGQKVGKWKVVYAYGGI